MPRHTAKNGLTHSTSVVSEALYYPPSADSRASGRVTSYDVHPHRDGSTVVPRGSVGHRTHQPIDEAEEKTSSMKYSQL